MRRLKSISPDSALALLTGVYGDERGLKLWEEVQMQFPVEEEWPVRYAMLINTMAEGKIHHEDAGYRVKPVGIEEFLFEQFYLGMSRDEIWPEVLKELIEINSGKYIEAVLTGAIGTAKTTIALLTQAYQLYILSCYLNPHRVLGIARSDEIIFIFQNLSEKQAKIVDYNRFKTMIDGSKYFTTAFPYDTNVESYLKFPFRIECRPVTGKVTATIGQNVYGGLIDEVNFMEVIDKSKRTSDAGTYDQADELYNSISMRRKSRFMSKGEMPGVLCIVSSRNYPGQFTDKKELERKQDIEANGTSPIFLYDKRLWDLRPDRFSEERFNVFVGNESLKPRISGPKESITKSLRDLVWEVPVDYKTDFLRDIYQAIRDILGISTLAKFPYFSDVDAISDCMDRQLKVLSSDSTDFTDDKVRVYWKRFSRPTEPRWVHIDLAVTSDSAGISMGYVPEFVLIERGEVSEVLPFIHIDFHLEIRPPKGDEIPFYKIRELLYLIRDRGINVKWISLDSYQSKDTQQVLRQRGFTTGEQSIDRTTVPYDITKSAILDRRVSMPHCVKLQNELARLEKDQVKGKVDHPPDGSKDLADALAGVIYGLTMRREVWSRHEIPMGHIPDSVSTALAAAKQRKRDERQ